MMLYGEKDWIGLDKSYRAMLRVMCSMMDSRKRDVNNALDSIIMQRYIGSMMKPFFFQSIELSIYMVKEDSF